jgi:uncharacterized protein
MAMILDADGSRSFEILSEDECLDLLEEGWLGRVAVTMGALPAIFPVNYCAEDGAIYFLTGQGTKLAAAVRSAVVAFEVDEADIGSRQGWSVLVIGRAQEVHLEEAGSSAVSRLGPWAPGDRSHLIRICPEFLSGRRISFRPPS